MALSGNKEVVFDLDAAAFSSDDFRMYQFKVKRCPRARPHDWTQCPFAHPGEKAKRRDPRRYRYSGTACPEFRRNGCCRRGDACPFAHGVFECWLHPSRYRTQMCTDGANCKRRVCFFAHTESELRKPEEDPVWVQQQLQAELAAEQQLQQQVQALKIFSALLATSNQNPLLAGSAGAGGSGLVGNGLFEMLKNTSVGSLASLLGLANTASAPAVPVSPEEKLRGVLQQLQQGQNGLTLLQLISLLEKVQQQQSPATQPSAPAAASAAASNDQMTNSSSQTVADLQAKLAQQLASESLQAQLAQLQKSTGDGGGKSALDVLSLLTTVAASSSSPNAQETESSTATAAAPAPTAAGAIQPELLSSTVSSSSSPPAENNTASPLASLAGLDPAVVALLQQPGLLQLAVAATAAAKEPAPPPNPLVNLSALEGLLNQLSLAQLNAAAPTAVPNLLEPSTPTPPTPTTPALEHNASADGASADQGGSAASAISGADGGPTVPTDKSTPAADGTAATPSGAESNKEDVLRNAKALVEMLNAKGTPPVTEKLPAESS